MNTKVLGFMNLDRVTAQDPLEFFMLFSSLSAIRGNLGQSSYAFANGFLIDVNQRR